MKRATLLCLAIGKSGIWGYLFTGRNQALLMTPAAGATESPDAKAAAPAATEEAKADAPAATEEAKPDATAPKEDEAKK